jgi:hypothetical protein
MAEEHVRWLAGLDLDLTETQAQHVPLLDLLDPGSCILDVSARQLLFVRRPVGACPKVAPPESDWPALAAAHPRADVLLITIDPVGRIASQESLVAPQVGPLPSSRDYIRFSDYDAAPPVVLPDASLVHEVERWAEDPFIGYVDGATGYITKGPEALARASALPTLPR